jgi:hypothetical protein
VNDATLTLPVRGSPGVMPLALLICATLAICVLPSVSASAKEHRSASVKREFQLTHPCALRDCRKSPVSRVMSHRLHRGCTLSFRRRARQVAGTCAKVFNCSATRAAMAPLSSGSTTTAPAYYDLNVRYDPGGWFAVERLAWRELLERGDQPFPSSNRGIRLLDDGIDWIIDGRDHDCPSIISPKFV